MNKWTKEKKKEGRVKKIDSYKVEDDCMVLILNAVTVPRRTKKAFVVNQVSGSHWVKT
jgi:hypothetical protein